MACPTALATLRQRWRSLSTLQVALLFSVAVHAGLLTLRFAAPESFNRIFEDTPLEVVLVNASSTEAPAKAQVIAQRQLAGGGDAADVRERATSPLPPSATLSEGEAAQDMKRQLEALQEQQLQLLAQVRAELAKLSAPDPLRDQGDPRERAVAEQRKQLLQLLAQIEKRINAENARPKRRYVSPAAREGVHALYYDALRRRIEDTGTQNFPEAGGRKLYGELTMVVAIDAAGRVVEVEIIESSGSAALDKRAIGIVRKAAPFGNFSPAMRQQFDQLVFASRFRFTRDEALRATVQDAPRRP